MRDTMQNGRPKHLEVGDWHTPLVAFDELGGSAYFDKVKEVSVGRCARISYLTHEGFRDPGKDVGLHDDLLNDGHMSPFEHVATPMAYGHGPDNFSGNFRGWVQYRKMIPNESDILGAR